MNTKQKETLQLLVPSYSYVLLTFWLSVSADLAWLLTEPNNKINGGTVAIV